MMWRWHLASWLVALAWLGWGAAASQAASVQVGVVDERGRPVNQAVVFLDSAEAKRLVKPLPRSEIVQSNRMFVPTVLPVTVGTEVDFPNRDTVRHHVYSFSPAKPFDLKLYVGMPAAPVLFDRPGVVVLGCNIHDQMVAWVLVLETPYFASSAADGQAVLSNVPAGQYRLRVWHSRMAVGAPAQEQVLRLGKDDTSVRVVLANLAEP